MGEEHEEHEAYEAYLELLGFATELADDLGVIVESVLAYDEGE